MTASDESTGARLRALLARQDKVLAVLHPPTSAHARIMEAAGCEAGFVGTGSVIGGITGLADVGSLTMTECVEIGGWIARSVRFPVILDGDTGHGGVMAIRRLVREAIAAGFAGLRIDDQPLESKRRTLSGGIEVVPVELAVARYRAAADMRDEINPDFVIMAQCYARDAAGSGLEDAIARLGTYETEGRADWEQLAAPHSIDEIRAARAAVKGPFSFMRGHLPDFLPFAEHLALGVTVAWLPGLTHHLMWAALWDFLQDFNERDIAAWTAFRESRAGRPYPIPEVGPEGEGADRQRELELRYAPNGAARYAASHGGDGGPR